MRVARALWRLNEAPGHGQRAEAAKRLGELRSPLAIRDLIRSLEDKSALVRDAAAEALGRIGTAEASEPLAAALCDPASGLRSQAARVLGMIGDITSVKALLNNMAGLDRELLGEVVDSLGRAGDWSAMLPLICLFDQVDDPLLRRKISLALGRLSEIRSVDEVMELLSQGRSSNWKQLHNL
jgi:HEAT repeat protein